MPLLVRAPSDLDQQHLLATSDVLASHVSGEHLLATRLSASGSIVFQGQFTDLQQAALQYTTHPAQPVGIQQQQQQMYLQNTQPQLQQQMYLQSTPSMPQSVMLRTISGAISMDTDARLTQAPVAVPLCGPQGSGSLAMPPLTTLPAVAPSLPAVTTTSGPSDAAAGQLPMPQMPLQFAPQPVEVQPQQMQQQVQVQQIAAPQPQQQQTPVETQAQLQAQTQQAPPQPAASQQTQLGVASVSAAGAAGAALAAATELGQELGQSTALAVAPTSAPIPMAMPAQPHMILPVATVVTPGSIAVAATPPAGLEAEDAAMLGAMAHGPVTMEDVTPVGVSPSPSHAPVPAVNGLVSLLSTGTTALAACTAAAALPTASSGGQELNVVS